MIERKIRIWVNSPTQGSLFKISTFNFEKCYEYNSTRHWAIEVPIDSANNFLEISCITGSIEIGTVEINYSWEIDPYYKENFFYETGLLEENEFDLSFCSDAMLVDLESKPLWVDTGPDNFSAIEKLIIGPTINSKDIIDDLPWYCLDSNSIFKCKILCTHTPESWSTTIPPLPQADVIIHRKNAYNKTIINQIDNRFNSFVKKFLNDHTITGNTILHDKKELPYAYKIRIQTQLVDNIDLIKDKNVIDFGADFGQFTYPCVVLGCKSVTSAQVVEPHNIAIKSAAQCFGLLDKIKTLQCDLYDLPGVQSCLTGIDTILLLGVIYHVNHHYQLLEEFTKSSATGIVIDSVIKDLTFW